MILNETLAKKILNHKTLLNFLIPDPDPWQGHPMQGYITKNNKVKGKYGELFVEKMMTELGHLVGKAELTTSGHDRVINDMNVEVKFSAAHVNSKDKSKTCDDVFTFNHLSVKKDWQRTILIGINFNRVYAVWFTKQDFVNQIKKEKGFFRRQQSGKNGGNDDWMFSTKNKWQNFLKEDWVKSIEQW